MSVKRLCDVLLSSTIRGVFFFFFKQKTAYEMQFGDWSSDVCSSDLFLADDDRLSKYTIIIVTTLGGVIGNVLGVRLLQQIGRASCRERV